MRIYPSFSPSSFYVLSFLSRSLSLSLVYSLLMSFVFYIYLAQLTKEEEAKERDEHFSSRTYLYIHLSSLSFSSILSRCCLVFPRRSSSSIFFLYARDREFRKNIKNEREREGGRKSLPISFLMSVFVSYLGVVNTHTHTHTQFFPSSLIVYHQNEQKTM